jgi:hypothetical protein
MRALFSRLHSREETVEYAKINSEHICAFLAGATGLNYPAIRIKGKYYDDIRITQIRY